MTCARRSPRAAPSASSSASRSLLARRSSAPRSGASRSYMSRMASMILWRWSSDAAAPDEARVPHSVGVALERLDRQPGRAPGLKAAVEVRRPVVPELLERRGGEARLVAGVAHDDQRAPGIGHALVAVRTVGVAAPLEHVARDEHAAGHDAVAPALALGADVAQHRPGVDGRARASRVDPSQPRPGPLEELVDPAHEGSLQSTAPATSVWLPSGRPRTSRAARAASSSASRSTPVSMPIS